MYRVLLNDDKESVFHELTNLAQLDYPQMVIEYEKYQDRCLKLIEDNAEKYDAIILDANGISSQNSLKEPNKELFLVLVEKAQQCGLRTYIFSGTLSVDSQNSLDKATENMLEIKGFRRGKNWFAKSATADDLLDRICDDLDEYNTYAKYYQGHEYLLDFVFNGWLVKKDREEFLDPLMRMYIAHDSVSAHGNHMRNILQRLLLQLDRRFHLCTFKKSSDIGYYGSVINCLEKQNNIPASFVIGPMYAIHKITNARSHDSIDEVDRELFFMADFSSFFLVARWFAKIMKNSDYDKMSNGNSSAILDAQGLSEGVVVAIENKDMRYVYAGDYQIEINKEWEELLNVGTKVRVIHSVINTGPMKSHYKHFVRFYEYEIVNE